MKEMCAAMRAMLAPEISKTSIIYNCGRFDQAFDYYNAVAKIFGYMPLDREYKELFLDLACERMGNRK